MILPTQCYEGFPMSIVEAFSVGTPVLCSDLGNAGSIVEEGITGRKFRADSPEELARAVQSCNGLCGRTYEAYLARYTAQENYVRLMQIYNAVRDPNAAEN